MMLRRDIPILASAAGMLSSPVKAGPKTYQAGIKNFVFVPPRIEIAVGDTVRGTSRDGVPHTVTGDGHDRGTGPLKTEAPGEFLPRKRSTRSNIIVISTPR